jgi:hypothetical protein
MTQVGNQRSGTRSIVCTVVVYCPSTQYLCIEPTTYRFITRLLPLSHLIPVILSNNSCCFSSLNPARFFLVNNITILFELTTVAAVSISISSLAVVTLIIVVVILLVGTLLALAAVPQVVGISTFACPVLQVLLRCLLLP